MSGQLLLTEDSAMMRTPFTDTSICLHLACALMICLGHIRNTCTCNGHIWYSPLTKEIKAFVVFTGAGAVLIAVSLFAIGMGVGLQFVNALALAIGIFVAAALCGMPATVPSTAKLILRITPVVATLSSV
jgi:hypothetical protein